MTPQKFLFVHQNFPGQFAHAAAELARLGHEVVAVGIRGRQLPGIRYVRYTPKVEEPLSRLDSTKDIEAKIVRGLACAATLQQLADGGFRPDVVVAHPGWGEALFCKDVFPRARLIVFPEFFYGTEGSDYNFDPEFADDSLANRARVRLKNSVQLHALHAADAGYLPTQWQFSQMPVEFRHKLRVIFDGIDTAVAAPNPKAKIHLKRDNVHLAAGSEVLTFVNRSLEPYRGFHVFLRALPQILKQRPNAHCLIVGREGVSYGTAPKGGGSWKQKLLAEVGSTLPIERVHFLGTLAYADYLRVLQVSRCHVYLTYPFVLSWSCLEAMSAGCVVLGSRTGPVQEVIEHGSNGLLFDFFDREALVRQAVDVLARPADYRALGEQARRSVVQRYDLKTRCLPAQLDLLAG